MEALVGLSLAANVIQVVDFTRETVSLFTKIYQKQSADSNLAESVIKIETLGKSLETRLSQSATILNQSQNSSINTRLPTLCTEVLATARELRSRLNQPATSRREAFKSTLKIKFGRELSKIAALDGKLRGLEQTLQTELLTEIWSRDDATLFQQQQSFATLDQNIKDLVQGYSQGQLNLQDIIQKDHSAAITKLSNDLHTSLSVGFNSTNQHVTQVIQSVEHLQNIRRQKEQLLQSVRFPSRNARRVAVGRAHEKTFYWIFEAPDHDLGSSFRKWIISDENPIFWIQGKPGSGKSTLVKFLISGSRVTELLNMRYSTVVVYSHFIWMADKGVDGTLRGMLCSLIHQILEIGTNQYLVENLIQGQPDFQRRQSPNDWETDELQLVLKTLLILHQGAVVIFIDGLDELVSGEDKYGIGDFLKQILLAKKDLKICISSRPEPEIKLILGGSPSMELQMLTKYDLERVAQDNLAKCFGFTTRNISKEEREELVEIIVRKAEGVFLWINLALTRLKKGAIACDTVGRLKASLQDIPSELKDLYRSMWDRLGSEQRNSQKIAAFVFRCLLMWKNIEGQWDAFLGFHLTLCQEAPAFTKLLGRSIEFYRSHEFLSACLNNQRLVEYHCAGLVEFVQQRNYVAKHRLFPDINIDDPRILQVDFIHRSLRDFLLEDGQSLLEQPNEEVVYEALFCAFISESMITTDIEEAGFDNKVYVSWVDTKASGLHMTINSDVYSEYCHAVWQFRSHHSLQKTLKLCRCWMQHARGVDVEKEASTTLWDTLYNRNFKLLSNAFEVHGLSNLLEEMAIHLDNVNPTVEESLALKSLSTYLIWQRLNHYLGRRQPQIQDYLKLLEQADMRWAYPYTVAAAGHAIPQLMTIPEVITTLSHVGVEDRLVSLRHLKQFPDKWIIGSVLLIGDLGGCLGTKRGVILPNFKEKGPSECYEVIFRASAATYMNRSFSKIKIPDHSHLSKDWGVLQQSQLKKLLCDQSQEMIEVLLVGKVDQSGNSISGNTIVFDPTKFEQYKKGSPNLLYSYHQMFKRGRARYYAPSRTQSDAISINLDPDFLMDHLNGPYGICYCWSCTDEQVKDEESRMKLNCSEQSRKDKVNAMKTTITDISLDDNKRIPNVLEHLRMRGHYIPTEDDLLEFVEAKSTFERVYVLDRLNREKAEKERWMTESTNHETGGDTTEHKDTETI